MTGQNKQVKADAEACSQGIEAGSERTTPDPGVVGTLMAVPMLITIKLISDRVESMRAISLIAGR